MASIPKSAGKQTPATRSRFNAWARRNPEQATKFDRLSAAARGNILSLFRDPGGARYASKAVEQADEYRRETRREQARRRREAKAEQKKPPAKPLTRSGLLAAALAHWRHEHVANGAPRGESSRPNLHRLTTSELKAVPGMSWSSMSAMARLRYDEDEEEYTASHPNPYWYNNRK